MGALWGGTVGPKNFGLVGHSAIGRTIASIFDFVACKKIIDTHGITASCDFSDRPYKVAAD